MCLLFFCFFEIIYRVKDFIWSWIYLHISGLQCVFKCLVMSKVVWAEILTLILHNFRGGSIRNITIFIANFCNFSWWIDTESTFSNWFWYDDSLSLHNIVARHFRAAYQLFCAQAPVAYPNSWTVMKLDNGEHKLINVRFWVCYSCSFAWLLEMKTQISVCQMHFNNARSEFLVFGSLTLMLCSSFIHHFF